MPLKVDHVRPRVNFAPLVLFDSLVKGVSRSFGDIDMSLSGITGRLPISIKLKNKRFITRQRDSQIIEFEHSHLFEDFGPRKLPHAAPRYKINVPSLFREETSSKTSNFLRLYSFIFERPILARTAISATENAVESPKKESTSKGIFPVRSLNKGSVLSTEKFTALTEAF